MHVRNWSQDTKAQRSVRLPVRSVGAWVAEDATPLAAAPPRHVPGVCVVDDLVNNNSLTVDSIANDDERKERQRERDESQRPTKRPRRVAAHTAAAGTDALAGIKSWQLRREAAKQHLAMAAHQLLQDPNKQVAQLRNLLELLQDEDAQVCRLAMLTLLAVFKDLVPAYRIRPTSAEEEPMEKFSKEVRAMRTYEATLLGGYHTYLKKLLQAYKGSNAGHAPLQQGRIAVKCMAGLLEAAPHFNYRSDLLQALVSCLTHSDQQLRETALSGLTRVLSGSQGEGEVATETVQLIADLVRRLNCIAPSTTLDCLMALRFPDIVSPPAPSGRGKLRKKSKKHRDDVDRSFLEAQAAADLTSRQTNQTATLEALFELLFRLLKHCTASGLIRLQDVTPVSRMHFSKKFPLLFPALRLLGKHVHLISVDYLQDIVAELRLLLRSGALPPEDRLRVLLTAAEVAHGQGDASAVDGAGFHYEVYGAIEHAVLMPLMEYHWRQHSNGSGPAGGDREDGDDALFSEVLAAGTAKAGEQVCFLAPRVLELLMLEARGVDVSRQAAFSKRMLAGVMSAGDTGLAMGLLCLLQRMFRHSRRLQGMLEHEAGGPSTHGYRPEAKDPAEAGALMAPFWELSLLTHHYHPHVAAACTKLAAGASSALLPMAASNAGVFAVGYTVSAGTFKPTPQTQ